MHAFMSRALWVMIANYYKIWIYSPWQAFDEFQLKAAAHILSCAQDTGCAA